MSIIVAILVFAVLVIVHEFGHFIVAKRSGVRVDEFAIGFPPRLWSIKRGETRYSINALPLGGYVLMPGENGELLDEHGNVDKHTFAAQSAGKRAAILVAGVTMNMILAIVLYMGIFAAVGQSKDVSLIGTVQPDSPAQSVGLQKNDRILTINGKSVSTIEDAQSSINAIIANDHGGNPIVPVTIAIRHPNGQEQTYAIQARRNPPKGQGHIGFSFKYESVHLTALQVPGAALNQVFVGNFQGVAQGFHEILAGVIKPGDAFAGPVGIVQITSDAASNVSSDGLAPIFNIMAYLSWNLAILNLLPIPGLDGGRLLLLFIEVLRRGRRLAPQREALINLAGLGLLLSLILIITVNDVIRIVSGQ